MSVTLPYEMTQDGFFFLKNKREREMKPSKTSIFNKSTHDFDPIHPRYTLITGIYIHISKQKMP